MHAAFARPKPVSVPFSHSTHTMRRETYSSNQHHSKTPRLYPCSSGPPAPRAASPQTYTNGRCAAGRNPHGRHCTVGFYRWRSRRAGCSWVRSRMWDRPVARARSAWSVICSGSAVGMGRACAGLVGVCTRLGRGGLFEYMISLAHAV